MFASAEILALEMRLQSPSLSEVQLCCCWWLASSTECGYQQGTRSNPFSFNRD